MPENTSTQNSDQSPKATTLTGVFLRITWMFFGIPTFILSGICIFQQHGGFGVPDIVFGACIPILLVARYIDIRYYDGRTADFEPATMAHWRGYAWRLVLGAVVFWAICHVGGYAVGTPKDSSKLQSVEIR